MMLWRWIKRVFALPKYEEPVAISPPLADRIKAHQDSLDDRLARLEWEREQRVRALEAERNLIKHDYSTPEDHI